MTYQVLVSQRSGLETDIGKGYLQTAQQLGVKQLTSCDVSRLYFVKGDCDQAGVERLASELLADPVTESFEVTSLDSLKHNQSSDRTSIEVTLLAGVTDPAAENLMRSADMIGVSLEQAATGERFTVGSNGELTDEQLQILTDKVFSNPVVQQSAVNQPIIPPFFDPAGANDLVETVSLIEANDDELVTISQERRL
ncbi:MAG: phosphoribosylformylglycinamidine synthase subunit PurS, partial [Anaerolineae bacterium]